jgi:dipeptidyl-peptidase 4
MPVDFPSQYAATRRFTLGVPRNFVVSPSGDQVYFLRSRSGRDPLLCLWRFDVATGEETLLVDPGLLSDGSDALPAAERARRERARESASGIVAYSTDASAQRAAFALAGSLFVADLDTGKTTIVETADAVFDPRFDPTGTIIAYVSGDELRLTDPEAPGSDRRLLGDDDILTSWGRAEFIAAEEMGRSHGYWWSPDGQQLLVAHVDQGPVSEWWIGDPARPATPPVPIRYPAAGSGNARVGLVLTDLGGATQEVGWTRGEEEGEDFEYLADVVWVEDRPPLIVRQTRDQRLVSIAALDLGDDGHTVGELTEMHRITDPVWVELMPGAPRWTDHGLVTIEDRTTEPDDTGNGGVRALCLDGRIISSPDVNVRSVLGDVAGGIMVTVWTDPTEIHVAVVAVDGSGTTMVTSAPGTHHAVIGGGTMVVLSATPQEPASVAGIGVDGPRIRSFAEPPTIVARPRFVGSGDDLRSAVFFPPDHDGTTPLPVLLDPYGGPHAQRVLKAHAPHLVSQWFADQGFAVVVTDGRGTPGRGPRFERAVWGDLAQPVLDDQITALDRIAQDTGLLDLSRVAIRGWSFGGYLAALAVLRRPDRIHAAIAGAPVTSWRLYDTHYTERYLGHPETYPQHYDTTDLILEADRLTRPLLLIHGLADDNVVAAHTLQLSTALLGAGRPHSVLPLSGVTHMTPQESIAKNLLLVQLEFLEQSVGADR